MSKLEYRVRWKYWKWDTGERGEGFPKSWSYRYQIRQTRAGADALVTALVSKSDEDHCFSDMHMCDYCEAIGLPPTEIKVQSRPVESWSLWE